MKRKAKEALKDQFADKIAFDKATRMLYSRDVGVLPRLVSLAIKPVPDAVFLPRDEKEIVDLFRIANQYKIPVIPRGAGTSGYGGALAYRGGIMVDLTAITEVEEISAEDMTVTAGAGITFSNLEAILSSKNQALRSYPSSAPSATLGGWFAQGGSGIGDLLYGSFRDQVLSVRLIRPDGEIIELRGNAISQHYELEGITGIITRLSLKTRKATPIKPILGSFQSIDQLMNAMDTLLEILTPFAINIETPTFIRLRQQATGEVLLSEDNYYALLAIEELNKNSESVVAESIENQGGNIEDTEKATYEWKERFFPLRLKRLGPGIILGESYIPNDRLRVYIEAIEKKFRRDEPSVEAHIISKKEAAVLIYFCDDDRRLTAMFALSKILQIMNLATKLGGRPYSTGLWLSGKKREFFGVERLKEIKKLKKTSDPSGIANPGKILGGKVRILPFVPISMALRIAAPFMKIGNTIFRYRRSKTFPPPSRHGREIRG
ncbi:MAG: FAD-binding oxidoreductase [Candidatus Thorarchaeota archaeon]